MIGKECIGYLPIPWNAHEAPRSSSVRRAPAPPLARMHKFEFWLNTGRSHAQPLQNLNVARSSIHNLPARPEYNALHTGCIQATLCFITHFTWLTGSQHPFIRPR
jgi:hypothetical protein